MKNDYQPNKIEEKWRRQWDKAQIFKVKEDYKNTKYYILEMFPYPSGYIHMGHVRNYCIGDVIARYKKMCGFNVLHPMGWDAFGLPAENAAIAQGIHPAKWTYDNIGYMRRQLKHLGFSYDWDREFATCDPDYYKWEQLFFLEMFERGLVYRKRAAVNWCPSCKTVLANEQVEEGQCWRCRTEVKTKELEQWFFKITAYAEELLSYCDKLKGWPEKVLTMQRNWIGKSEGVEIRFPLLDHKGEISVFTTRPDTIYGVTFLSLAPEHPLVLRLVKDKPQQGAVKTFIEHVKRQNRLERMAEDTEKEGIFIGAYCRHPLSEAKIPIYISNFVLMEYGTGAVMGVPAHDERDFKFAKKYDLPIKVVIQPPDKILNSEEMQNAYVEAGVLDKSPPFNGLPSEAGKEPIVFALEKKGLGKKTVSYRLRDWSVSRQRYWGAPIPIVYCEHCGIVAVPKEKLPVALPLEVSLEGKTASPLINYRPFYETTCPNCGNKARRETDTMDTFVESSWYFIRYSCPDETNSPIDKKRTYYFLPVDQYIGGIEHAVMHLLYARFFTKVLRDLGWLNIDEPFTNLLTQGMVCKETYRCPRDGYLIPNEEVKERNGKKKCFYCGREVEVGRLEKMSKSKKNVVDPQRMINKYGADTVRLFTLFAAPPERDLEWSAQGVEGVHRFLQRLWRFIKEALPYLKDRDFRKQSLDEDQKTLYRKLHQTIKKVTQDIERFHLNTAISALMELLNTMLYFWQKEKKDEISCAIMKEVIEKFVILVSPFTPYVAEELWHVLGYKRWLIEQSWPKWDEEALREEFILVVIQINGKVRGRMQVPADISKEEVEKKAFTQERIRQFLAGKEKKQVIWIPKRLINIVV